MSARTLAAVLLLMLGLGGCATSRPLRESSAPMNAASGVQAGDAAAAELPSAAQRLLVRRVQLTLEAENPGSLAPAAEQIVTTAGGYVESLFLDTGDRLRATLRVPATRVEEVVAALEQLAEVEEKQIAAVDVTEQSADLEARILTLVAVRDRLRQYLERAGGVPDVLTVERELARVQSEIEILEGRLERLRTDVALAEVTLEVRQERILGPIGRLFVGIGWAVSKLFVIRW